LEAIDPATASISHEVSFEVTDIAELCSILGLGPTDLNSDTSYRLAASTVSRLKSHYGLKFHDTGFEAWLRAHNPNDDFPYKVHTGRELAMMLAKTKPLAAFSDDHPNPQGESTIPEQEFDPYVRVGRIIKREFIVAPSPDAPEINGQPIGSRRVLYALPGEEWRIDAYLQLWQTMKTTGWTAALEREEGTLLGYEDRQNDIHMKGWKRPAPSKPSRHHLRAWTYPTTVRFAIMKHQDLS
jgi:hypothetical protein